MPQQQYLYNGLARLADYSILHGNAAGEATMAQEWSHLHGQRACLRPSWLAYGKRVGMGQTSSRTAGQRDKVKT